jgi:hypothetical protein
MRYIHHHKLHKGRKATYSRFIASECPNTTESKIFCLTIGGNQIDYPGRGSTPTAVITTAKILFNSVVLTPNARIAVFDLNYFYLGTTMACYEYMRILISAIQQ